MKIKLQILSCLLALLFVSSCFVGKMFTDTTIKRYRSAEYHPLVASVDGKDKDDSSKKIQSLVDVEIFSTKIGKSKIDTLQKSLWDLEGKGEAKLLEILHERSDTDAKFFSNLEKKYLKPKSTSSKDYSTQDLKMILSVSKFRNYASLNNAYSLADRIEYLKIRLENRDNGMHFVKWNKFETEFGTLNIGDVTFNESISVTGGVNASRGTSRDNSFTAGGDARTYNSSAGINPSLSAGSTTGIQEVQKVLYRYLALNGKISREYLEVEQEGIREIDLAGNVIIDVQMKFDKTTEHQMISIKDIPDISKNPPKENFFDKLKVFQTKVILPDETILEDITVDIVYDYIYRNVSNHRGRKTFFEWDDKVKFYGQNARKTEKTILRPKDYMPQVYSILASDGYDLYTVVPRFIDLLEVRDTINQNTFELKSLDEQDLNQFLDYLRFATNQVKSEIASLEEKIKANPRNNGLGEKLNKTKAYYEDQIKIGKYALLLSGSTEEDDTYEVPFSLKVLDGLNEMIRVEPFYKELQQKLTQ